MGGKSAENHLHCLVTTLSNELAKQLTWKGQRQTVGIKSIVFANIIIRMCVYFVIFLKKLFCTICVFIGDCPIRHSQLYQPMP